jgi:hypothetical protein
MIAVVHPDTLVPKHPGADQCCEDNRDRKQSGSFQKPFEHWTPRRSRRNHSPSSHGDFSSSTSVQETLTKSAQITNCYVERTGENRRSVRKMGVSKILEKVVCYNGVTGRANDGAAWPRLDPDHAAYVQDIGVMMELEAAAQGFLARMSPRMSPTAGAAGLVDTPAREGNWRVIRKTIRHAVFWPRHPIFLA